MEKTKETYEVPQTVTVDFKMKSSLLTGSPDFGMAPSNPFESNPDEVEW